MILDREKVPPWTAGGSMTCGNIHQIHREYHPSTGAPLHVTVSEILDKHLQKLGASRTSKNRWRSGFDADRACAKMDILPIDPVTLPARTRDGNRSPFPICLSRCCRVFHDSSLYFLSIRNPFAPVEAIGRSAVCSDIIERNPGACGMPRGSDALPVDPLPDHTASWRYNSMSVSPLLW